MLGKLGHRDNLSVEKGFPTVADDRGAGNGSPAEAA
jgi:hypothetical protein